MAEISATTSVMERLLNTRRLPSLPATALRVLELVANPDVSVPEIASVISNDPVIAARLLKYANSPLVASRRAITTIPAAIVTLGMRTVKVTALGFSLVKRENFSKCPHFHFDLFWAHASATATAARGITAIGAPQLRDDAFVAGLLARIGKLTLATALPEEYDEVLGRAGSVMHSALAEETAAFGANNVEVGAALLAKWKLPSVLVEAVRCQSDPDAAQSTEVKQIATAVQHGAEVADVLCGVVSRHQSTASQYVADQNLQEMGQQFRGLAALLDISLKDLPEPEELEERARGFVEELSVATDAEIAAVRQKAQELEQQTRIDALTGIANRRAFDERLAAELERSRRHGRPLALLMADIDHFKRVNDRLGHVIGDRVLKSVAEQMKSVLRESDFLARYGGEEFTVIAAETDLEGAIRLAERLRLAVDDRPRDEPTMPHVTISVGAAALDPPGKIEPQELIVAADKALYGAKRSGRNRCCNSVLQPGAC